MHDNPTAAALVAAGPIKILDQGHVRLIDVMGDDEAVYDFARRSYRDDSTPRQSPRGLIRYCARKRHDSIFAAGVLHLEIDCPIYVSRQGMRYRTFDYSEFSQRYGEVPDRFQRTEPDAWRLQDPGNKQGSGGMLGAIDGLVLQSEENFILTKSREVYASRIMSNVAREQARKDLPLSTYTTYRMIGNLRNLFHAIEERDPRVPHGPQEETRAVFRAIAERIVAPLFPICWEAFVDYRLEAMTLSKDEQLVVRWWGDARKEGRPEPIEHFIDAFFMPSRKREAVECRAKLARLGLVAGEGGGA